MTAPSDFTPALGRAILASLDAQRDRFLDRLASPGRPANGTEKIAIVVCADASSKRAIDLALEFRLRGVVVNSWWGKPVKAQIAHARKCGYSNLVYVGGGEGFQFQDAHEYPRWLREEYGTVNFEKRHYRGVEDCVREEMLTPRAT